MAIAAVPLGVFFPYATYRREHRRHHRASRLTDPNVDPESFYHDPQRWHRYSPVLRAILRWNQSLLGRLLLGPAIQIAGAVISDLVRVTQGDRRPLREWTIHIALVTALLAWVTIVMAMPWWEYIVLIAYPGASLSMLRSFYEHTWSADAAHRTTVVENRFPFGLLFLNNNYHVVHHAAPALPWYRIPAVWNEHRDVFLQENGARCFSGYGVLARRWLIRSAFEPVSPVE
jgi:fatty acid desaturase